MTALVFFYIFKSLRDPWIYSATQKQQANLWRPRISLSKNRKEKSKQDMLQREVAYSSRWENQEASHHHLRNPVTKILFTAFFMAYLICSVKFLNKHLYQKTDKLQNKKHGLLAFSYPSLQPKEFYLHLFALKYNSPPHKSLSTPRYKKRTALLTANYMREPASYPYHELKFNNNRNPIITFSEKNTALV